MKNTLVSCIANPLDRRFSWPSASDRTPSICGMALRAPIFNVTVRGDPAHSPERPYSRIAKTEG